MRYQVTGLDDSADGMERLRSQSEFILLADPADYSLGDIERQWIEDLDRAALDPEESDYEAAEEAIRMYCRESANYLRSKLEERQRMIAKDAAAALEAGELDENDELGEDYFAELPPFRLYVCDTNANA